MVKHSNAAAAAAKSLQSCPTLCDPIESSPPGSPVPGILQARTLEWVAISFSHRRIYKGKNMLTLGCLTEKKERLQNNTQSVTQRLWETHFHRKNLCKHVLVAQSCSAVCNPMACSLPVSSVYEIFQARILQWVAIPFYRGSSQPRGETQVSRTGWQILYHLSHQGSPREKA